MDEVGKQRLMAIFIGVVMVVGTAGFALMSAAPEEPAPVEIPDVMNRMVTTEERVSILRSGKVLIEYFHNESCISCIEKEEMYTSFANSDEFGDYVVLAYGTSENETMEWMLNLDGTRIDLSGISTQKELRELFCDVALIKPDICILREI